MKSCTNLEQSKKLAEILPLESADMCYRIVAYNPNDTHVYQPYCFIGTLESDIPCWSLAALLNVLPDGTDVTKDKSDTENEKYMCTVLVNDSLVTTFANNPVDACVEMILKLHKLKML